MIAGVFVYFFVDKKQSKIILFTFLIFVIILGVSVLTYLECERRKSQVRREIGLNRFVEEAYVAQHIRPQPSAPSLSERSSWALFPRKWSTGTWLPSYSQ